MPQFYLKRSDNTFSDFGNYPEKPENKAGGEWIEGFPSIPVFEAKTPLDQIVEAVKQIPVEKRTDSGFGSFMNQCLLAIQNNDQEGLAHLLNSFQSSDSDYQSLISQAKTLFGLN